MLFFIGITSTDDTRHVGPGPELKSSASRVSESKTKNLILRDANYVLFWKAAGLFDGFFRSGLREVNPNRTLQISGCFCRLCTNGQAANRHGED
jgi:hypothetical protein